LHVGAGPKWDGEERVSDEKLNGDEIGAGAQQEQAQWNDVERREWE
jgi:hypothetical protein